MAIYPLCPTRQYFLSFIFFVTVTFTHVAIETGELVSVACSVCFNISTFHELFKHCMAHIACKCIENTTYMYVFTAQSEKNV